MGGSRSLNPPTMNYKYSTIYLYFHHLLEFTQQVTRQIHLRIAEHFFYCYINHLLHFEYGRKRPCCLSPQIFNSKSNL